jgi:hypothetical protein
VRIVAGAEGAGATGGVVAAIKAVAAKGAEATGIECDVRRSIEMMGAPRPPAASSEKKWDG